MPVGVYMQDIGKRVKTLRTSKRLSQRDLATRCELSQATIANIERGGTQDVKGYVLECLAKELDTTTGFLLEGSSSQEDHESVMMLTEITSIFNKMSTEDQEAVLRVFRSMSPTKQRIPLPTKTQISVR